MIIKFNRSQQIVRTLCSSSTYSYWLKSAWTGLILVDQMRVVLLYMRARLRDYCLYRMRYIGSRLTKWRKWKWERSSSFLTISSVNWILLGISLMMVWLISNRESESREWRPYKKKKRSMRIFIYINNQNQKIYQYYNHSRWN